MLKNCVYRNIYEFTYHINGDRIWCTRRKHVTKVTGTFN